MKDYILKQMETVQRVAMEPQRAEALLAVFESLQRAMGKVAGKMPFDSEPSSHTRALNQLRLQE